MGLKFKIGDVVTLRNGSTRKIVAITDHGQYPIKTGSATYTNDGYLYAGYPGNALDIVSVESQQSFNNRKEKTMAKTVEGYEVKIGECYTTRSGGKALVTGFDRDDEPEGAVVGTSVRKNWYKSGVNYSAPRDDLMRPYGVEAEKVYDISKMYRLWYRDADGGLGNMIMETREQAVAFSTSWLTKLAITSAKVAAHEDIFFEGEGLND